jgi:hypothetical protein
LKTAKIWTDCPNRRIFAAFGRENARPARKAANTVCAPVLRTDTIYSRSIPGDMIYLKNEKQIGGIRRSCKMLSAMYRELIPLVKDGIETIEIDRWVNNWINNLTPKLPANR